MPEPSTAELATWHEHVQRQVAKMAPPSPAQLDKVRAVLATAAAPRPPRRRTRCGRAAS